MNFADMLFDLGHSLSLMVATGGAGNTEKEKTCPIDASNPASPAYLDELFPRTWVQSQVDPDVWFLRDKRRDWAVLYSDDGFWCIAIFPGNGKHEFPGAKPTLEEAKAAVEQRLAR